MTLEKLSLSHSHTTPTPAPTSLAVAIRIVVFVVFVGRGTPNIHGIRRRALSAEHGAAEAHSTKLNHFGSLSSGIKSSSGERERGKDQVQVTHMTRNVVISRKKERRRRCREKTKNVCVCVVAPFCGIWKFIIHSPYSPVPQIEKCSFFSTRVCLPPPLPPPTIAASPLSLPTTTTTTINHRQHLCLVLLFSLCSTELDFLLLLREPDSDAPRRRHVCVYAHTHTLLHQIRALQTQLKPLSVNGCPPQRARISLNADIPFPSNAATTWNQPREHVAIYVSCAK